MSPAQVRRSPGKELLLRLLHASYAETPRRSSDLKLFSNDLSAVPAREHSEAERILPASVDVKQREDELGSQ
jgi:hypothetical protein